ncbi:unnamed protein product [Ixodes persulcatus]
MHILLPFWSSFRKMLFLDYTNIFRNPERFVMSKSYYSFLLAFTFHKSCSIPHSKLFQYYTIIPFISDSIPKLLFAHAHLGRSRILCNIYKGGLCMVKSGNNTDGSGI